MSDFKFCKQKDEETAIAITELKLFYDAWVLKHQHIIQAVSYGEPPILSAHFGDTKLTNLILLDRLLKISFDLTEEERFIACENTSPNELSHKVLFPEKLAKANAQLKGVKMP